MLNKSFMTNFISLLLIGIAFIVPKEFSKYFLYAGLFALSGSVTNQLAIHMLFEKVPFLYGSGVITSRFEGFKASIKNLMMREFFTKGQLDSFFAKEEKKLDLVPIIEETDFSPAYDALTKTVMESSFGSMLGMFGGEKALEALKDPFSKKMKDAVLKIVESDAFNQTMQNHLKSSSLSQDMLDSIEKLIDTRLCEVTPQMVKEMIERIIKEHLGWLVVWGGVFGGLIGVVSSILL
ncbi:DUF445 family protein [Sulfurimonas sp. HSL-1716]|uniref:DUF445 family protein n=1 Tax=Hydrocurvibacter sulfurireducens TaxID=3131937 RepID=UPI0031FA45E0